MITAAQDQALRTNAIKAKAEKQNLSPLCRMCGEKDESMGHLVGECSKLAPTEYKHRHENNHVKLLWDFNIQTSTCIQARRPDVVVVDRDKKTCNIIDIAVPGDAGIVEKEKVPRPTKRGGITLECQSKSCSYCGWSARRRHTQPF